jgi:hypothetical protein
MRTLVVATLMAIGAGLVGASGAAAAPADGAVLERVASTGAPLSRAGYYRRHGRLCYAKCYREFIIGPRVCRRFC